MSTEGSAMVGTATPSRANHRSSSSSSSMSSSQPNSPSSNKGSTVGGGVQKSKTMDVNDASFFAAPMVPFKIVPGHHGGVVSSMSKLKVVPCYYDHLIPDSHIVSVVYPMRDSGG